MSSISHAAVLAIAFAGAAWAQEPAAPRSALDGYRPFTEEAVVPWRQANDTVRAVGGWRAYAREAQAPAPAPAASAASAAPAASSATPAHGHQH